MNAPLHLARPGSRSTLERSLWEAGISTIDLGPVGALGTAVLVADGDAARVRALLRGQAVKVYTLSGGQAGGFSVQAGAAGAITLALFPARLAEDLLQRASGDPGLSAADRFYIGAYLATYFNLVDAQARPASVRGLEQIRRLASDAGINVEQYRDRAALDACLADAGWRPPIDMLERLGLGDSWIRDRLLPSLGPQDSQPPGLAVYFCRERAQKLGAVDRMRNAIAAEGMEILADIPLTGDRAEQVRLSTRGGNWGNGPYPVSGGPPVRLWVALDVFPVPPDTRTRARHPFLDNARTLAAKLAAREAVLQDVESAAQFNPVHSTDTSTEALRLLRQILEPTELAPITETVEDRQADIARIITQPWRADMASGGPDIAAALVTLPDATTGGGRLRRVYRPQYRADQDTALEMHQALVSKWPDMLAVTQSGAGWHDLDAPGAEFHPVRDRAHPVPVSVTERLRALLEAVGETGACPLGWAPGSALWITGNGQLRCAGFDRIARSTAPVPLSEMVAEAFYTRHWYPVLGLPRNVFLSGDVKRMRLHRWLVYPLRSAMMRGKQALRALRDRLRRGYRG
ncbi:hypothetical protein PGB28_14240 [Primorskyibacter aestuariivivens]|uniref:hypothetical protein n=1 Tax=Primorskyibacter aestuariivivens TaxID=1888912 RepID=UPI0023018B4A|nr:hypothetical protein [Primorskyibacter aestuariivivens]MDA7429626.1 hypothetical protein [Primorskyibacter aestuariivivens]